MAVVIPTLNEAQSITSVIAEIPCEIVREIAVGRAGPKRLWPRLRGGGLLSRRPNVASSCSWIETVPSVAT